MQQHDRAILALEDGTVLEGRGFGATGRVEAEIVFNTAMTGYQEILTDPSYHGQMVVMTYPHIGNTGVNDEDPESNRPHVAGFIAREFSRRTSSFRATRSLEDFMGEHGIVGLHEVDTRQLTRILREKGCQNAVLVSGPDVEAELDALRAAAAAVPDIATLDTVSSVTSERRFEWRGADNDETPQVTPYRTHSGPVVAVLDCGSKRNILRSLREHGVRLLVFPAHSTAAEILDARPDGVLVTNGPGDPATSDYLVATIRELIGKVPLMGICLGHQLLALAAGAETYKLKFGHHGANHPVLHEETGRIEITSQNHNYAVDPDSAAAVGFQVTHRSLFDGTVQGMMHPELAIFSVQYHPEACPGPHDSHYLWQAFLSHIGSGVR